MDGEKLEETLAVCRKCYGVCKKEDGKTYWYEHNSGYSVKLWECPICGTINVLEYVEDEGLYVNEDERYY